MKGAIKIYYHSPYRTLCRNKYSRRGKLEYRYNIPEGSWALRVDVKSVEERWRNWSQKESCTLIINYRCRQVFESLKEEYKSRVPYISYLVKIQQSLLCTLAHLDRWVIINCIDGFPFTVQIKKVNHTWLYLYSVFIIFSCLGYLLGSTVINESYQTTSFHFAYACSWRRENLRFCHSYRNSKEPVFLMRKVIFLRHSLLLYLQTWKGIPIGNVSTYCYSLYMCQNIFTTKLYPLNDTVFT